MRCFVALNGTVVVVRYRYDTGVEHSRQLFTHDGDRGETSTLEVAVGKLLDALLVKLRLQIFKDGGEF